jgi:protein O-GlcNAc transferase
MQPRQSTGTMALRDLMREAMGWHRRGDLDRAQALYRAVLEAQPNHPDALANLGALCVQRGLWAESIRLTEASLAIAPDQPLALNNLGSARLGLGQHEEALACYERAIASKPDLAEAHYGRANVLHRLGRLQEALDSHERALVLRPDYAGALNNQANVLCDLDRLDEALQCCDRAAALLPDSAVVCNTRGTILYRLGQLTAALASYDRAVELDPRYREALANRGIVLQHMRRYAEALTSFDAAIALDAGAAESIRGRGTALHRLGLLEDALASHRHAIALEPDNAPAHQLLGDVLYDLGRLDEAVASYDRAILLDPRAAAALSNRGNALRELNRFDEAVRSYELALALKPELEYVPGALLHTRARMCDWSVRERDEDRVLAGILRGAKVAPPFAVLATPATGALRRRCAEIWIHDRFPDAPHARAPASGSKADARIRLAYFSADFRDHPVGYLAAELFAIHDRTRFEVFGFGYDPRPPDAMRDVVRAGFDMYFDVARKTDEDVAAIAREAGIDIAIDLGGHTAHSRLGILAARAAPVQVHFLGYPGTTGAPFIDYLIADPVVIPARHRAWYSERIAWLPETCQVNDRRNVAAQHAIPRAEAGLPERAFVFCCFNNCYKIAPPVFDTWMRLLRRVESSVLWLYADNAIAQRNLREQAAVRGVDGGRIVFAPWMPLPDHLARHRLADLFLDTFDFNAHTTASIALWSGLPVLTCPGDTFISRIGASLLGALGLPELIAASPEEYEDIACALAMEPPRLRALRDKLWRNRLTQPLFDTPRFAAHLEDAYRQMVLRARAGLPPDDIRVEPRPRACQRESSIS